MAGTAIFTLVERFHDKRIGVLFRITDMHLEKIAMAVAAVKTHLIDMNLVIENDRLDRFIENNEVRRRMAGSTLVRTASAESGVAIMADAAVLPIGKGLHGKIALLLHSSGLHHKDVIMT